MKWIAVLGVGVLMALLLSSIAALSDTPDIRRVEYLEECTGEISAGVSAYLRSPRRREHAIRNLIWMSRRSHVSGTPPSTIELLWDDLRVGLLDAQLDDEALGLLVCSGVTAEINGKVLVGIPSVARELLGSSELNAEQAYLMTCGLNNPVQGARRALLLIPGEGNWEDLQALCGAIRGE